MAAMVFGMPLLTKNMDPAELKAMQEQQAALGAGSPWEALTKVLSGGPEDAPAAAAQPSAGERRQAASSGGAPPAAAAASASSVRARKAATGATAR